MEYSRILAIFVTFLCVARAVWQESAEGVCVPTRLSVTSGGALFTESYYSSFGVSVAPGQRASGTLGCWRGPWRRWDPWLTEWPVVVGVAGGVGGTGGVRVVRGVWWDNPRLLVWPGASVGPDRWLTVWPVVVGVARGSRWDLCRVARPVAVGGTCGGQWGLRSSQGPTADAGRLAGSPFPAPSWPASAWARRDLSTVFPEVPFPAALFSPARGQNGARDKCLHTDPPLAAASVRGLQAAAPLPVPAPSSRKCVFVNMYILNESLCIFDLIT